MESSARMSERGQDMGVGIDVYVLLYPFWRSQRLRRYHHQRFRFQRFSSRIDANADRGDSNHLPHLLYLADQQDQDAFPHRCRHDAFPDRWRRWVVDGSS